MQVRRHTIVPLESIVRGYITGSAWSEYKKHGTVHGMPMPAGLQESQKLEKPIWTPSTKAEQGEHDENISRDKAVEIVGESVAGRVEEASLLIYEKVKFSLSNGPEFHFLNNTDLINFAGQTVRRRARHHHRRHQIRVRPRRGRRDRAGRRGPHTGQLALLARGQVRGRQGPVILRQGMYPRSLSRSPYPGVPDTKLTPPSNTSATGSPPRASKAKTAWP
jgi:hypothetical protein